MAYSARRLILDISAGTITEFSHTGWSHLITIPHNEYEALLEADKWKAHPTLPTAELAER